MPFEVTKTSFLSPQEKKIGLKLYFYLIILVN